MSDNFLDKIIDGVKGVAPAVANYVLPGSGSLVESLIRTVTGDKESPIEDLAQKVQQDPALYIEFQRLVMDQEIKLADIDAKRQESVNRTMRVEAKSDKWPQYCWRPFNGFTFPLAVILIYFILPIMDKAAPTVPQWVWLGWLSILGVATWDRGKEKRALAGEQKTGLLEGVIKSIRGSK